MGLEPEIACSRIHSVNSNFLTLPTYLGQSQSDAFQLHRKTDRFATQEIWTRHFNLKYSSRPEAAAQRVLKIFLQFRINSNANFYIKKFSLSQLWFYSWNFFFFLIQSNFPIFIIDNWLHTFYFHKRYVSRAHST